MKFFKRYGVADAIDEMLLGRQPPDNRPEDACGISHHKNKQEGHGAIPYDMGRSVCDILNSVLALKASTSSDRVAGHGVQELCSKDDYPGGMIGCDFDAELRKLANGSRVDAVDQARV
eukprot:2653928-Prymnesium_polylepis.4